MAKALIKWPGGKAGEIIKFENMIPEYDRYIEPFLGGGAVFFHLAPKKSIINDISSSLMEFYRFIKQQNPSFREYLLAYGRSIDYLLSQCNEHYPQVLSIYQLYEDGRTTSKEYSNNIKKLDVIANQIIGQNVFLKYIVLDTDKFHQSLVKMAGDKFVRTVRNNGTKSYSDADLKDNLITGFTSGFYIYFRDVFNDISLGRIHPGKAYAAANFYFIREYCYGSMFRYNKSGEFNIPYGGMTYNRKNFISKIDYLFHSEVNDILSNAEIHNEDFETFLNGINLTGKDFIFLDPPYDTDFSDYEGRAFDKEDQKRLADTLKKVKAKFILVIKNTDYIYDLYKDDFRILVFDNQYTYNVRSRNERSTKHLIITNIPV